MAFNYWACLFIAKPFLAFTLYRQNHFGTLSCGTWLSFASFCPGLESPGYSPVVPPGPQENSPALQRWESSARSASSPVRDGRGRATVMIKPAFRQAIKGPVLRVQPAQQQPLPPVSGTPFRKPFRSQIWTIARSAGVMPLIRAACPNVSGRTSPSFCRASRRKPGSVV